MKVRHYMYITTNDNYSYSLIKQSLGDSDRLGTREKILNWIKNGINYAANMKEIKTKRRPIAGLILKESDPFEKELIKLKKKYGKKSSKLFINAICYSIKNGDIK